MAASIRISSCSQPGQLATFPLNASTSKELIPFLRQYFDSTEGIFAILSVLKDRDFPQVNVKYADIPLVTQNLPRSPSQILSHERYKAFKIDAFGENAEIIEGVGKTMTGSLNETAAKISPVQFTISFMANCAPPKIRLDTFKEGAAGCKTLADTRYFSSPLAELISCESINEVGTAFANSDFQRFEYTSASIGCEVIWERLRV